ncbi:hypothetical protein B0H17DRAFT_1186423 [Mycena rosella]|uniref:Uncharacterized protein n=1 Tax=Mycena rosella TaxID=1033263 RepID=A0AAD7CM53_MYCRO|nr:hypothetical protein B0H17DRAFT_1186423 [Mycena rosella]
MDIGELRGRWVNYTVLKRMYHTHAQIAKAVLKSASQPHPGRPSDSENQHANTQGRRSKFRVPDGYSGDVVKPGMLLCRMNFVSLGAFFDASFISFEHRTYFLFFRPNHTSWSVLARLPRAHSSPSAHANMFEVFAGITTPGHVQPRVQTSLIALASCTTTRWAGLEGIPSADGVAQAPHAARIRTAAVRARYLLNAAAWAAWVPLDRGVNPYSVILLTRHWLAVMYR